MRDQSLSESMRPDEMGEVLETRGYELLGEGNFSAVYAKPGERTVLKVGDNDDDWLAYARLCKANQGNPHFPRIYRIGALHGFLIARMERLERVDPSSFLKDYLSMLAYISIYVTQSYRRRSTHWEYASLAMEFRHAHPGAKTSGSQFEDFVMQAAMKCPPPIAQALMKVRGLVAQNGLEFDFKPENFMKRADGTLVLTDPIWNANR